LNTVKRAVKIEKGLLHIGIGHVDAAAHRHLGVRLIDQSACLLFFILYHRRYRQKCQGITPLRFG
jgi:hypothetical protein